MAHSYDSIVLGSDPDALVAAIGLSQRGSKVLLLEGSDALGGTFQHIEFAPGFRAAPLAADAGHVSAEVVRLLGTLPVAEAISDPAVISLADGEPLLLRSSVAATAESLRPFSARDAQSWPTFAERMASLAGFLAQLYRAPPPRIDVDTFGELLGLATLGRSYRSLGQSGMPDLLRTLPMALADLLDDVFESDRLKGTLAALGVMDVPHGPISGGTAYTFLHRHVGASPGIFSERARLKGGSGTLVSALVEKARALGVTIHTSAPVSEVIVRDHRIAGVRVQSGEEIGARIVLSGLDAYHSLLELLDPVYLDPSLIHAVRNIRFRGVTTKLLIALETLPAVPGADGPITGSVVIAPGVKHVERAYDAAKYGRCSDEPFIELRFPSVAQPDLAPAGKHVAVVHVQFTPYRLREQTWDDARDMLADRVLSLLDHHIPGFTACVSACAVLTPPDLESRFGVREGAVSQGELMLDQILFMRPVPGFARYATPIPGYFLCGAGTHPGVGLTGVSGLLASRAALSA